MWPQHQPPTETQRQATERFAENEGETEHIMRSNVAIAWGQVGSSYKPNKRQVACRQEQNHVAQGKDWNPRATGKQEPDMSCHPRGKPTDRGKVIWPGDKKEYKQIGTKGNATHGTKSVLGNEWATRKRQAGDTANPRNPRRPWPRQIEDNSKTKPKQVGNL